MRRVSPSGSSGPSTRSTQAPSPESSGAPVCRSGHAEAGHRQPDPLQPQCRDWTRFLAEFSAGALWKHDELPGRSPGVHFGVGFGDLVQAVRAVDRHAGLAGLNRVQELLEHARRPLPGSRRRSQLGSALQDNTEAGVARPQVVDRLVDLVEREVLADRRDVMSGSEVEHRERRRRAP